MRPEAGDVGVRRRGAARGVDLVDLADLHTGPARQLEHVAAGPSRREALEAVEDRVEHDRPGVQEAPRRPRRPPRSRAATSRAGSGASARAAALPRRPRRPRRSRRTGRGRPPIRPRTASSEPDVDRALAHDRRQGQRRDGEYDGQRRARARAGGQRAPERAAEPPGRRRTQPDEHAELHGDLARVECELRAPEVARRASTSAR